MWSIAGIPSASADLTISLRALLQVQLKRAAQVISCTELVVGHSEREE
jgi:hypothetical protein